MIKIAGDKKNHMAKFRLGFLVSGQGSNLQAVMDQISEGHLDCEISCVISDVKDAYALQRAQKANIPAIHIPGLQYQTNNGTGN